MKRSGTLIVLATVVAIILWIRVNRDSASPAVAKAPPTATGTSSSAASAAGKASASTASASGTAAPQVAASPAPTPGLPSDSQARASLQSMSNLLAHTMKNRKNLDALVEQLKRSGQNPFVTRDGTGESGYIHFVKTRSPLPGTRHFHAQFMIDENNQHFVQHISFEFKPGPTALKDAVQAAQQSFSLGRPQEQTADFVKWKLDEDYIVWIKKKSANDLRNDRFNAYDPATDVGTVELAVEQEIHHDNSAHGHGGHSH